MLTHLVQLQTGDEGKQRAEEATEPLKRWWQSKQSSAPTDYFTNQEQDIPGGHVSHTEEAHQSSGQGATNASSAQHTTGTSSWQNNNSQYASQGNELQQQGRQLVSQTLLANFCFPVSHPLCQPYGKRETQHFWFADTT